MKKSVKASLLSALVFPGVGHLYLGKYVPGLILAIISILALGYLTNELLDTAQQLSDGILNGTIQPDIESITAMVSSQHGDQHSGLHNATAAALLFCWLFGMVDSYRAGKRLDTVNR